MSGGPRGTSPPLDLAAIEARLSFCVWFKGNAWMICHAIDGDDCGRAYAEAARAYVALDAERQAHIGALLAHTRALRVVLQPFAAWYDSGEEDDDARPVTLDSGISTIYYQGHHGQPVLTLGDLKRAAAVLAAAQDGPA